MVISRKSAWTADMNRIAQPEFDDVMDCIKRLEREINDESTTHSAMGISADY